VDPETDRSGINIYAIGPENKTRMGVRFRKSKWVKKDAVY
jgi:hypothetical protein